MWRMDSCCQPHIAGLSTAVVVGNTNRKKKCQGDKYVGIKYGASQMM